MQTSNLLALVLMLCGAAMAMPTSGTTTRSLASDGPDCAAIEDYCKCENGDFQCETDVDCEWCRDHNAWGNGDPPKKE